MTDEWPVGEMTIGLCSAPALACCHTSLGVRGLLSVKFPLNFLIQWLGSVETRPPIILSWLRVRGGCNVLLLGRNEIRNKSEIQFTLNAPELPEVAGPFYLCLDSLLLSEYFSSAQLQTPLWAFCFLLRVCISQDGHQSKSPWPWHPPWWYLTYRDWPERGTFWTDSLSLIVTKYIAYLLIDFSYF